MDGVAQLKKRLADYTTSLYDERDGFREHLKTTVKPNEYSALGYLDDQFVQLQQLQDESNPEFVVEVVSLFFQDSQRLLSELAKALEQQSVDFRKVDAYVHQLKGSSSSIGAQRVQRACISFRNYCDDQNIEGCLKCLQQLKNEYSLMKNKLETLFKLEQQLLEAGG